MKKVRTVFSLILIWLLATGVSATELLIPGGQLVGMQLQDDTVTVAAFDETLGSGAKKCGLQTGDRILRIDNTPIHTAQDIRTALAHSDGQVELAVLRGNKTKQFRLSPVATADGPRLGVYLRQGTTGVGTVTYYDPESEAFAALGHGVNTQNGNLLQMQEGTVFDAEVVQIKKGTPGTPGQLVGTISHATPTGTLEKNTNQGVFGTISAKKSTEPLPVAEKDEVCTGNATIRSTIGTAGVQEYSVEILKIYPASKDRTRNLLLKITDPKLLNTTGGIVQGMSGSPIIQDGKLVGAVTHVLVNDPTTGYGIFIENMLDAAA